MDLPSSSQLSAPRLSSYVLSGVLVSAAYVAFDIVAEAKIRDGTLQGTLASLHSLVDHVLPLVGGVLLGVSIHYLRVRSLIAAAGESAARSEALRSRLQKVERDQAVWVLMAAVLHEINNPLHALGLILDEHSASEGDSAHQTELSGRAQLQMDRVREKLRLLRATPNTGRPTLQVVPLGKLAIVLADDITRLFENEACTIKVEGERELCAHADANYVRSILENLLANSMNALRGGADGVIVIELASENERAVVRVSDNGPPLDPPLQAALFDPMRSKRTQGLGLGLPIARALSRAMGGELSFDTERGKTFKLELPLWVT